MAKHKVFHHDAIPARAPTTLTIAVTALMLTLEAGPLAWGIVGTVLGFIWLGTIVRLCGEEWINPFKD